MPTFLVRFLCLLLPLLGTPTFAADPVLTVKPDHENGIYAPGEKITWTIDVKGDRAGMTGLNALPYSIKQDGQVEVGNGTLDLTAGPATLTATRADAGTVQAQIFLMGKPPLSPPLAAGGAVISPDKIAPAFPAPADFDDFWQGKLKELDQVPINPVLEKKDITGVSGADGMDYYKVTLDNIRGMHVQGQLARPTVGEKFPAMLVVQFAGIYALSKEQALAQAKPGWLVLNISAHDLPIDETPAYYKNLQDTTLKGYALIGCDDREKSYFLHMFLGDVRAVEYLRSRPDWDGKTLVVTGASQGGLQSFATAALCPQVTDVLTMVPAGCDACAMLATPPRASSWPGWISIWTPKGDATTKIQNTAPYFDGINFAARIHCPTLVAVGLIDESARPTGVMAAFNGIKAPKELVIMPTSNHYGTGGTQAIYHTRFDAWKNAIQHDEPLPIPAAAQ